MIKFNVSFDKPRNQIIITVESGWDTIEWMGVARIHRLFSFVVKDKDKTKVDEEIAKALSKMSKVDKANLIKNLLEEQNG